jgi:DNA polymerase-3 subunit epsilon
MWLPFRRGPAPPELDPRIGALAPAAARYVAIDSELTGLDERSDCILSLGAVRIVEGRIDLQDTYYQEVNPASVLKPESIVVHGITPSDVQERPGIHAVLAGFLDFCGGDILVGHFISIDLAFLRKDLARSPGLSLPNPAIDTWPLYEWLSRREPGAQGTSFPRLKDPRLNSLADALKVDRRGAHNALTDAYITAQVFQRLLRQVGRWGLTSVAELVRIGNPNRAIEAHDGEMPFT